MDHFKATQEAEFVPDSIPVETMADFLLLFHFQNKRGLYDPPTLHKVLSFPLVNKSEYFFDFFLFS